MIERASERRDRTTKWAVVVVAAVLTRVVAADSNPHNVLLVDVVAFRHRSWRIRGELVEVDLRSG